VKLALAQEGPAGPTGEAGRRQSPDGTAAERLVALGAALGVCASFVLSGTDAPLPAFGWAAAFLFLAVERDVRTRRIPNWLTFPALAGALALAAWQDGLGGALHALAGAGVALAILFLPFALRWLGAGDVKAVMVLGALWGREAIVPALWWMILVGGLLAVALLASRGELGDLLRRWGSSFWHSLLSRRPVYHAPARGSAAVEGLPFAVAMGLGAAAFQLWGAPWA